MITGLQSLFAADVVITSEQKGAEVIPLGYVEFPLTGGEGKSIPFLPGNVLVGDLEFSGRFRIQKANTLDSAAKNLFKQDGALAYLQGQYSLEGDQFNLNCELIDIETGEKILKKKYSGPKGQLRSSVHQFADEMVYQLFGEKGIAQSKIVFVHKVGGAKEICIMDYDGAEVRDITGNKSINLNPIFLGSRDKVLFTSYKEGRPQFFQADLTSKKTVSKFPSPGMTSAPNYNRMDKEIVYASTQDGNSEIYRRPADGGKSTRLTFATGIDTSPGFSPNGYEIVFVSDRGGKPLLYIMDRDGSNTRGISYDFEYCGSPSWSPKGDRIALAVMDEGNNLNIYTISPDGKEFLKLTSGARSNESPSWSPDGRHIAFMSNRTGSPEIFVMDANGKNPHRITESGGNSMASWSE